MAERRGHPAAGWVIGVATLIGTGGALYLLYLPLGRIDPGAVMVVYVGFVVVLVLASFGLRVAVRVAAGRRSDEVGYAVERHSGEPGPAWLVAEPGADLKEYPRSDESMARLEAGTLVREVRRLGEHVRVVTPDGLTGWVAADRLEPAGNGEGGGDG